MASELHGVRVPKREAGEAGGLQCEKRARQDNALKRIGPRAMSGASKLRASEGRARAGLALYRTSMAADTRLGQKWGCD